MEQTTNKNIDIESLSDEEALGLFINLLSTRVGIETAFVPDERTGDITHQIIQVSCGDYASYSQPEPLGVILRPAGAPQGETIN